MGWINPRTWGAEAVNVSKLNTEIKDNMTALKDPPSDVDNFTHTGSVHATLSASWAAVAGFSLTITTTGGDILVSFFGNLSTSSNLDIAVNGLRQGGVDGIVANGTAANRCAPLIWLLTDMPASTYTIELYGKGSATLTARPVPQFFAREFS